MSKSPQKGNAPIIVLVVALLATVGFGAYYYGKSSNSPATSQTTPAISPTPTPTIDETANWKQVRRGSLSFRIPTNWNYLKCNGREDLIFVGPNIQNKDETIDCAFDVFPGEISVVRTNDLKDISALPNTANEDLRISETEKVTIGGKQGIVQKEELTQGQGEGTYYVAYVIHSSNSADIITLDNVSEKENLDKILSTFKFND